MPASRKPSRQGRPRTARASALAALPILALAACATSDAAADLSDAALRADVKERLTRDAFVERYDIDVRVEDAVVTLRGSVANAYEREQAAEVAREVEGVRRVDNRIVAGEVNLESAPEPLPP